VDSLETDLVIESGEQNVPRASLWTKALIDKAIEMDFDKKTERFGNLKVFFLHSSNNCFTCNYNCSS
jgi:hypothetical protein